MPCGRFSARCLRGGLLRAVRQRMSGGGDVLAGASGGVAGSEQGRRSQQSEESQDDREIFAHNEDPFVYVSMV